MVNVVDGIPSFLKRIGASLCAMALLVSLTACENSDEEPLITPDRDATSKLGTTGDDLSSVKEYEDIQKKYLQSGMEQIPEWLKICNSINRKALRKLGFDPQNDLMRRAATVDSACIWKQKDPSRHVSIAKFKDSIDQLNKRPEFTPIRTVEQGGTTIYLGEVDHFLGTTSCSANFERDGESYVIEYFFFSKQDDQKPICDAVVELAQPN